MLEGRLHTTEGAAQTVLSLSGVHQNTVLSPLDPCNHHKPASHTTLLQLLCLAPLLSSIRPIPHVLYNFFSHSTLFTSSFTHSTVTLAFKPFCLFSNLFAPLPFIRSQCYNKPGPSQCLRSCVFCKIEK